MWAAIAMSLAVVTAAGAYFALKPGHPVRYAEDGPTLRAFDAKGRTVWQLELPVTPAAEDPSEVSSAIRKHGFFADLNGDGKAELIYHFMAPGGDRVKRSVLCIGEDGTILWKYQPAGAVTDLKGARHSDDWEPSFAGVLSTPRRDGGVVIVASHHGLSWPCRVVALTAEGKQVAEYWHPGWLFAGLIQDVDGDGVEEVILGGVNDGYAQERYQADVLILPRDFVSGQSRGAEGDHRQIAGVPAVSEDALVLFPKLPFPGVPGRTWVVDRITASEAGLVVRVSGPTALNQPLMSLHFTLDRHLQCIDLVRNPEFDSFFAEGLPGRPGRGDLGERVTEALMAVATPRNRFAVRGGSR